MPPRGDNMAMDDPAAQVVVSSSSQQKKHRSRSSKNKTNRGEKSSSNQKPRPPQDEQQQRPSSRQRSGGKEEEEEKVVQRRGSTKKEHKFKKSSGSKEKKIKQKSPSDSKKSNNTQQRTPPTSNTNKRITKNATNNNSMGSGQQQQQQEGGVGVTVSQFMIQQQQQQNEASQRKNNATLRQKMMEERMGKQTQHQHQQNQQQPQEGEAAHYFDDDDSDYDNVKKGAVVPRNKNNRQLPHPPTHAEKQKIVDTIPADHPSSSVIQTHRTCTLCHRTLPRSQFSERDRYSVNLSIAPGATCRTCSMTVCAVRLKSMPGTEQLLLEYANRGMRQGLMALEGGAGGAANNGRAPIAGLLESDMDGLNNSDSNALIVRRDAEGSGLVGKQLTLYGGPTNNDTSNPNNNNIMGMQRSNNNGGGDVNSPFSGQPYGHSDIDRPSQIANCKYIDTLLQMPSYLNLNAFGLFGSSEDVSVSLAALEAVRMYGTMEKECFRVHDCDGEVVDGDDDETKKQKKRGKRGGNNDGEKVNPKSIVCLVLNEGPTPRTAILASQHYGWTALSIDPTLSEDWDGYHDDVPGFTGYSGSIGDFMDSSSTGEFTETMIEFRQQSVQHLVIIGIQKEKDSLRLKGNGHINEIRSRYEDVPTTLVSVSPVRKATLAPQRREGQCGSKLEKDVGYEPNCSYLDEGVFSTCRMVEVWNFHNAEDDDDDNSSHVSDYSREEEEEYQEEEDGYNREKERMEREEHARREKEEQTRRAASGRRKSKKSGKKQSSENNNKNGGLNFLEDRVTEFHKERPDFKKKNNVEDKLAKKSSRRNRGEEEMEASLSTLSTKETLERKTSTGIPLVDGNPYVRSLEQQQEMHEETHEDHHEDHHEDNHEDYHENHHEDYHDQEEETSKKIVEADHNDFHQEEGDHGGDYQEEEENYSQEQDNDHGKEEDYHQEEDNAEHQEEASTEYQEGESAEVAVWAPPDEEVANQVWEKALAKHGKQESFCNQFEDYYDNNRDGDGDGDNQSEGPLSEGHHSEDHHSQEDDNNSEQEENDGVSPEEEEEAESVANQEEHGLPPGWEAIHDPSSGDYYYNNWETGEVTWLHPLGENSLVSHESDLTSPSQDSGRVEGGIDHPQMNGPEQHPDDDDRRIDDRSVDSRSLTSYNPKSAAAIATSTHSDDVKNDNNNDIAPPLTQYNSVTRHSIGGDDSENESSQYLCDDQSSASSGIAALSRWSKPVHSDSGTLGQSQQTDGSPEDDDNMIAWSDDEQQEKDDKFDPNDDLERRGSGTSQKQRPWHKNDSTENNDDSFVYD